MQLTQQHKEEIKTFIRQKEKQLGSQTAVSTFLEISTGTLSQMLNDEYKAKGDSMWLQVGTKLGWRIGIGEDNKGWQIAANTHDCKVIIKLLNDAKSMSLFMPISDYAGIGKSTPLKYYAQLHQDSGAVFYIKCREWGKTEFLNHLTRQIGLNLGRGFKTHDEILDCIIGFFSDRASMKPLLIIDEYDKLKAPSKRVLIPLYNELEDVLSVVVAGTEHLKTEIKAGVTRKGKGYDEIDSRLGREYMTLMGSSLNDIREMCKVNGLVDADMVKGIFEELKPVRKMIKVKTEQGEKEVQVRVATDLRRLKRIVQREQLKQLK